MGGPIPGNPPMSMIKLPGWLSNCPPWGAMPYGPSYMSTYPSGIYMLLSSMPPTSGLRKKGGGSTPPGCTLGLTGPPMGGNTFGEAFASAAMSTGCSSTSLILGLISGYVGFSRGITFFMVGVGFTSGTRPTSMLSREGMATFLAPLSFFSLLTMMSL